MQEVGRCIKGGVLVLKDARTIVTQDDRMYINLTGNNALSKGGSGDVLSGMIGGLLAQGSEPLEAASLAVCIHGLTAELFVEKYSSYSMMASDILNEIKEII
jgi:NAD(P)H-hydrate epimerase